MNILIATDNYYPNVNGASYSAQRLAYSLAQAGHVVGVLAPSRRWHSETFNHDGVHVTGVASFPLERIRRPLPGRVHLFAEHLIATLKPDIVHLQSHFVVGRTAAIVARAHQIPVVGTNHFMPENLVHYFPMPLGWQTRVKRAAWNYFLKTYGQIDAVTSPTQSAARILVDIGLRIPVQIISNGIDIQQFRPGPRTVDIRSFYHLPNRPILLFVGRLDKEKHLDDVMRALPSALASTPFQLVLVGDGAERTALHQLVQRLRLTAHVSFLGFVPDDQLPAVYAASDAFIMPGTVELQSMATMEAMASGLPIIAANALALPELVHDGDNGLLFEHRDRKKLTTSVQRIMADSPERTRMGKKSREIIQAHGMPAVMTQWTALYQRLRDRH